MGYAQDTGYVPDTVETIVDEFREWINEEFDTEYDSETFEGSGYYRVFYGIAQLLQQEGVKTSEIFQKLQQYFITTNERISRPRTTSPGIIEALEGEGYIAALKPMIEADAGKINVCVDEDENADDYAETKLAICTLLSTLISGGVVSFGSEAETIVLSNSQSFDFKYHLPNRIPVGLRITTVLSSNNQNVISTPEEQKEQLMENIAARYRLGKNFEPDRYYSTEDAPWAASIVLEWTDDVTDGELDDTPTWHDEPYVVDHTNFDDLFLIDLSLILVLES